MNGVTAGPATRNRKELFPLEKPLRILHLPLNRADHFVREDSKKQVSSLTSRTAEHIVDFRKQQLELLREMGELLHPELGGIWGSLSRGGHSGMGGGACGRALSRRACRMGGREWADGRALSSSPTAGTTLESNVHLARLTKFNAKGTLGFRLDKNGRAFTTNHYGRKPWRKLRRVGWMARTLSQRRVNFCGHLGLSFRPPTGRQAQGSGRPKAERYLSGRINPPLLGHLAQVARMFRKAGYNDQEGMA